MSKNPGPYRKFRNTISPSHTCIITRAYMYHIRKTNTTGVGKIFYDPHMHIDIQMRIQTQD